MNRIKIPVILQKFYAIFAQHGYEAYLVGGAVRDMLLGKPASDWDIATNATPQEVMRIFHRVIPTGLAHGTVTVLFMGAQLEVTTYRTEHGYSDGRHPDSVSFAAKIQDDLGRRDFTINAIAASLRDGSIEDPFDGRGDLKRRLIRAVGKASDRFLEDGLRPIRAIRFSAQLGFCIHADTYDAIKLPSVQEKIAGISIERFRDELVKLLKAPQPSQGLTALEDTNILARFIPALAAGRGVTQKDARGFHEFDVLDHNFYACDGAPCNNEIVRLAALFHDVGKTATRTVELKRIDANAHASTTNAVSAPASDDYIELIHFHGHEQRSAQLAKESLIALRFPNATVERVCHLIAQHMFHYEPSWSDAAVRRFIVRVGLENIDDLFLLRYADIYGMHRTPLAATSETVRLLNELKDRIQALSHEKSALSLKAVAVNGNDLLALGIPKGRHIGQLLNELFQCVLDAPAMNTREQLLLVAKRLAAQRGLLAAPEQA